MAKDRRTVGPNGGIPFIIPSGGHVSDRVSMHGLLLSRQRYGAPISVPVRVRRSTIAYTGQQIRCGQAQLLCYRSAQVDCIRE